MKLIMMLVEMMSKQRERIALHIASSGKKKKNSHHHEVKILQVRASKVQEHVYIHQGVLRFRKIIIVNISASKMRERYVRFSSGLIILF